MKHDHEKDAVLIQFLRECCFDTSPSIIEGTLEVLKQHNLLAYGFHFMRDRLPDDACREAADIYREQNALDLRMEVVFNKLSTLFQQNKVRFCPLKGADLSWRVYPSGALRPKCDIDILFHPDDCEKAIAILEKDGWANPYKYRSKHHYMGMRRSGVYLEPHFNLPHFDNCSPFEIWSELRQEEGTCFQLPLELNLLMLFHHCRHHSWGNGIRLLLDCGFLLKKEGMPDWEKMNSLARQFKLDPPELLFAAFADFFPKEALPAVTFSMEDCDLFREVLLCPMTELREKVPEMVMSTSDRFSWEWWKSRLAGMRPIGVRIRTQNQHGNYGRLFVAYIKIAWQKLGWFWRYRHGSSDPNIQLKIEKLERIEEIFQCRCTDAPPNATVAGNR